MFDRFDPSLPNQIADIVISNIQTELVAHGLKKIARNYIGMGPVPAEDCCPDLVGWVSNVRLWDANSPDGLRENRVLANMFGIAWDFNIRLGLCFLEGDADGAFDSKKISDQGREINKYGMTAYIAAVHSLSEFTYNCGNGGGCEIDLLPQPMSPYNTGGCAGWNMIFTIGVL